MPSGSQWGELIKSCFRAPPGKLLIGIDSDSLEDRISALTTKDPSKLKIYAGSKQYSIVVNGREYRIAEDTPVEYLGKIITGEELYALLQNSSS